MSEQNQIGSQEGTRTLSSQEIDFSALGRRSSKLDTKGIDITKPVSRGTLAFQKIGVKVDPQEMRNLVLKHSLVQFPAEVSPQQKAA